MSAIAKLRGFKRFMAELFSLSVRQWIYSVSTATVPLLTYIGWADDNAVVFIIGILNAMFATTIARLNAVKPVPTDG